jgi:hypothetical protein
VKGRQGVVYIREFSSVVGGGVKLDAWSANHGDPLSSMKREGSCLSCSALCNSVIGITMVPLQQLIQWKEALAI